MFYRNDHHHHPLHRVRYQLIKIRKFNLPLLPANFNQQSMSYVFFVFYIFSIKNQVFF